MSRGLWNTAAQFAKRGYAAKALDISTSLFYPRAEEQQASLPGEQPYDADAARIHKSVRVCSHMVHQKWGCCTCDSPSFIRRIEK